MFSCCRVCCAVSPALFSLSAFTAWLVGLLLLVTGKRFYRSLAQCDLPQARLNALPSLSILVPACNEAATVERAMRSLLALSYPCLEIMPLMTARPMQRGRF